MRVSLSEQVLNASGLPNRIVMSGIQSLSATLCIPPISGQAQVKCLHMSPDPQINPGLIVLFGSGETSPSGGKIIQALAPRLASPLRARVLETPAGFELNSAQVAGRVADFM